MAELREALELCADALRGHTTSWLTVSPLLSTPYEDAPSWTPYTRWGARACERGEAARKRALEVLGK